jgi:hypothetical protein
MIMHVYPWQKQIFIEHHFETYCKKDVPVLFNKAHTMKTDVVVTELFQAFLNLATDGGEWSVSYP